MKNKLTMPMKYFTRFVLVMLPMLLISYSGMAQDRRASTSAHGDPVKQYMLKNSDDPVVQFLNAHPGDQNAYHVLKLRIMMRDDASSMSESDLSRLREQHENGMAEFTHTQKQINNGMSYEKASQSYAREMKAKEEMNKATIGNQRVNNSQTNEPPSLSAPDNQ